MSPEYGRRLPLPYREAGALARREPQPLSDQRPVDVATPSRDQLELEAALPQEPVQGPEAGGRQTSFDA